LTLNSNEEPIDYHGTGFSQQPSIKGADGFDWVEAHGNQMGNIISFLGGFAHSSVERAEHFERSQWSWSGWK
jgi:hypothetical protein